MLEQVKQAIRDRVFDGYEKVPVADLERRIARETGVPKGLVKNAAKALVAAGELQYTYVYGTSFLEPSFNRPVRVSERIVLKPPDMAWETKPGDGVITLAGGAAFGNGAHPTTCLALEALDDALGNGPFLEHTGRSKGLDVGTGTGVLAIALARLGVQEVVGTDIDPCAISEARHNVSRNRLSDRITILDMPVESLGNTYAVIVANLAYPTLKRMSSVLATKLAEDGLLILSGFKAYGQFGLRLFRETSRRRWGCVTLGRKSPCVAPNPPPKKTKNESS
jgi:ribosomal protein L11 methyltransferase